MRNMVKRYADARDVALKSPDDFLMTRTGAGQTVTFLVNDAGTIACSGGKPRRLSGPLLIQARLLVRGCRLGLGERILHVAPAGERLVELALPVCGYGPGGL